VFLRVVILALFYLTSLLKIFLLFILHSNILMYADDVKLCLSFKDCSYSDLLQADLVSFYKWCKVNLLNLNCPKGYDFL